MISFNITSKLPTLNEYIGAERTNKYIAATLKKKFTNICAKSSLQIQKLPDKLYDLEIHWTVENNKADADNIYFAVKFILDGMVESGRIPKDGRKNIRHISHKINTDKTYNVKVCVYDAENSESV